jgi:outer membrane biosynthesis protein TonB
MRSRIPLTAIFCAACAFTCLAQPLSAQTVSVTPRPAVAAVATPVVQPAPVVVNATVAPAAAVAPIIAPDVADQTLPSPPAPPEPPGPPAPPTPPQAPKAQPPKVVKEAFVAVPEAASSNMNVRIDVTIIDQTGSGAPTKKTVSLTVADGGRGSVRSGVTVPIPSTTFAPQPVKEGDARPIGSSWSYRDMGLSLDVTGAQIRGNYVRLRLAVEYNPVDEKMAAAEGPSAAWLAQGPASFARFSQSLDLSLENGKPLVVASSSDPVPSRNRTASLEVKATILK